MSNMVKEIRNRKDMSGMVKKREIGKNICQEWDSNPCPFGPVPETGALDQLGHLDFYANTNKTTYLYKNHSLHVATITSHQKQNKRKPKSLVSFSDWASEILMEFSISPFILIFMEYHVIIIQWCSFEEKNCFAKCCSMTYCLNNLLNRLNNRLNGTK